MKMIKRLNTSEEGYWREYGNQRLQRQLTAAASMNKRVAKNVVIFVGDGMGPQVGHVFDSIRACTGWLTTYAKTQFSI